MLHPAECLHLEIGELTHRWTNKEKYKLEVAGQRLINQRAWPRVFPEP